WARAAGGGLAPVLQRAAPGRRQELMGASRRKLIVRDVDFLAAGYVAGGSVRFGPLEIGNRIGRAAFDLGPGSTLPFALEDEEYTEITDHDGVSLRFTGKA